MKHLEKFRCFFKGIVFLYIISMLYFIIIHKLLIGRLIPDEWMLKPNLVPFKNICEYISYWYHDQINLDIILRNLFAYILVFIPLGIMLPFAFKKCRKWRNVLFLLAGLATIIQIFQELSKTGIGDIDDVILAIIGAMVGYGVYSCMSKYKGSCKIFVD